MSKISMDLVKELREKTQVSMMDCKKALESTNGDIEAAIVLLRKKGSAIAAKRADNATNNGRVEAFIAADSKKGSLVEICCETDFSANTADMKSFAENAAKNACSANAQDKEALMAAAPALQDQLSELLAKIGEKIDVKNVVTYAVTNHGLVNVYIHPGSTIGIMIEFASEKELSGNALEEAKILAKDVCMQVAVHKPAALNPEDLDPVFVAKERAIAEEQSNDGKKPAAIVAKIIENRMNKLYEEICLISQRFIKNDELTIKQYVAAVSAKINNPLTIKRYVRFAIGR